jgi:hypothetical protein
MPKSICGTRPIRALILINADLLSDLRPASVAIRRLVRSNRAAGAHPIAAGSSPSRLAMLGRMTRHNAVMRICLLSIATTLCASGPARKLRDAASGHST